MPVKINDRTIRQALVGQDSYGLLFILLIVDYLVVSLDHSARWGGLARALPLAVTALFAVHTSAGSRNLLRFAQITVVVAFVAGLSELLTDNRRFPAISYFAIGLLLVAIPVVILRRVLPREEVDVETIFAALDVYILIGLIFAAIYVGIAGFITHPPFLAQPGPHDSSDYVYLSFITLTTVGFGDLTPLSNLARTVVVLEALIGQMFLVVLVARLVSVYSAQNQDRRRFLSRTPGPRLERQGADPGQADQSEAGWEVADSGEGTEGAGAERSATDRPDESDADAD